MPKKRITLMLPPALWQQTQAVAHEKHTSASEYVAEALQAALRADSLEARLEAARALIAMELPIASPEDLEAAALEQYEACGPELRVPQ